MISRRLRSSITGSPPEQALDIWPSGFFVLGCYIIHDNDYQMTYAYSLLQLFGLLVDG